MGETTDMTEELAKFRDHLRGVGYRIDSPSPDLVNAEHDSDVNIQVEELDFGARILCSLEESPKAAADRQGYLEFVNTLNNNNGLICWGTNENGLWGQAVYFGGYDPETFTAFLETYNDEVNGNEALQESDYVGR